MPLLNYTTSIDPMKTVGEITNMLVRAGASEVSVGYDGGQPSAISFAVRHVELGELRYRLPARLSSVEKTLQAQRKRGEIPPRYATRDQASRVAWRIVKDWMEAQLAIVESGVVTLDEVMLPYQLSGKGDRTVYQAFCEQRRAALEAPKG